ncbi:hypothetical protein GCM10009562_25370 [Nocardioides aquaticus]
MTLGQGGLSGRQRAKGLGAADVQRFGGPVLGQGVGPVADDCFEGDRVGEVEAGVELHGAIDVLTQADAAVPAVRCGAAFLFGRFGVPA